jgi:tyrosyl-tRNA synthetase
MDTTHMSLDDQVAILMQGTEYGDEELKQNMTLELRQRLVEAQKESRPLRVYCGFDPRTSDLHLGHTVVMRKMRQFQQLGHEVTFLIGNYTSLIGDPSDKDKLRPRLSMDEVAANGRTYAEQAYKILDPDKTTIRYNAEWLSELSFAQLIQLASSFTVQQFINNRENFRLRWEKGDPIYLHETFYAIMQGYDAYMLKADVQIGGTDQMFNIMHAARKLMTALGAKPNIAVIMDILPGTDGEIKMSKSLGNHIPILSVPEDMYGKVMSVPDKAMPLFFRLVTRWLPSEIAEIEQGLREERLHPKDVKMKLAHEIVSIFHNPEAAEQAQEHFKRVFQQGSAPEEMETFTCAAQTSLVEILSAAMKMSRSEARRMIQQNGVRLDGETLVDGNAPLPVAGVLQAGKRRFIRVKFE